MEDAFQSNLNTLKELILDEEKIVTYISLSKELCIHVNEAKSLLNRVVQDIRKTDPVIKIHVCYVISGLVNKNSVCTNVCSESELNKLRNSLSIIFYEHIYCVSKGMQDVDSVALSLINKFEDFSLCTGLVKANSCSKRTGNEIINLKSMNSCSNVVETKPSNALAKNTTEKKKEPTKDVAENSKKTVEVKLEPVGKPKILSPRKDSKTKLNNKSGTKPVAKSIAGFFGKSNSNGNKAKVAKEGKQDIEVDMKVEVKTEMSNKEENTPVKTESNKPIKTENNKLIKTSNKAVEKKKLLNTSLEKIRKNAKIDQKRKRVLCVSDSESETETNDPFADNDNGKMAVDNESDDEIPPTPTANVVKITSAMINSKKRRKIVDKTYTDKDGYLLTKKEEVFESCSENEEEVCPNVKQEKENVHVAQVKVESSPKQNGKSKKRKVSPPQKGKQQMLTNFFKKV